MVSNERLSKEAVIECLRATSGLPTIKVRGKLKRPHRTIYEAGVGDRLRPSGHFYIDYAAFPGGTSAEVPLSVIKGLERDGVIVREYPDQPEINAWKLADLPQPPAEEGKETR